MSFGKSIQSVFQNLPETLSVDNFDENVGSEIMRNILQLEVNLLEGSSLTGIDLNDFDDEQLENVLLIENENVVEQTNMFLNSMTALERSFRQKPRLVQDLRSSLKLKDIDDDQHIEFGEAELCVTTDISTDHEELVDYGFVEESEDEFIDFQDDEFDVDMDGSLFDNMADSDSEDDSPIEMEDLEVEPVRKERKLTVEEDGFFSMDAMEKFLEESEELYDENGAYLGEQNEENDGIYENLSDTEEQAFYDDFFDSIDTVQQEMETFVPEYIEPERRTKKKQYKFVETTSDDEYENFDSEFVPNMDGISRKAKVDDSVLEDTPFARFRAMMGDRIQEEEEKLMRGRDWTLMGETTVKKRAENALLDVTVDFDSAQRPKPVFDEDFEKKLVDMVIERVRYNEFDNPIRVTTATNKKVRSALDDSGPGQRKSLLEQNLEDYIKSKNADYSNHVETEKYEELKQRWSVLSSHLTALTNFNYTPPPVDVLAANVVVTQRNKMKDIESNKDLGVDAVAPHEIYKTKGEAQNQEEMTKAERKAKRQRSKAKKHRRNVIEGRYRKGEGISGTKQKANLEHNDSNHVKYSKSTQFFKHFEETRKKKKFHDAQNEKKDVKSGKKYKL
ncbi:hypothetical protein PCE1_001339 [Barthelona sp. PCE]